MKKYFLIVILIYSVLLLLTGCKKNDVATAEGTYYMKGKLNGTPFDCTYFSVNKPEPVPGYSDPAIRINAGWQDYNISIMDIYEDISTGTYVFEAGKYRNATLDHAGQVAFAGDGCSLCSPHLYGSGRITIQLINAFEIKGTFEFTTDAYYGSIMTVSDGEFYMKRS